MEIKKTCWTEDFAETCQDIMEDAILLDALAAYAAGGGSLICGESMESFPPVFSRLCGYLSQHTSDLRRLENRLVRQQRDTDPIP